MCPAEVWEDELAQGLSCTISIMHGSMSLTCPGCAAEATSEVVWNRFHGGAVWSIRAAQHLRHGSESAQTSAANLINILPCRSGVDSDGTALGLPFTPVVLTFSDISYYVPAPSSHV